MPHPATQRIKAALAERFQKREWAVPLAFRERPSKVQMRYLQSEEDTPADVFSALGGVGMGDSPGMANEQIGPEVFQQLLSQGLASVTPQEQPFDPNMMGAQMGGPQAPGSMQPMPTGQPGMPQAMSTSPGAAPQGGPGGIDPMMLMAALYGA